ncbi:MAG: hypothetical protein M3R37_01910 [Actinomycetota bacterium]|nr:hypothetical protein [Actinomycetota bacterium]
MRSRILSAVSGALFFLVLVACAGGSVEQPAAARGPGPRLQWPPPRLDRALTVRVDARHRELHLDSTRDYVVKLPRAALRVKGGLVIDGGHNVVLVGGEIQIPPSLPSASAEDRRGLYLENQTGTVHVEGLLIRGRDLSEGINLSEGAETVVQLENIRVENVHARDTEHWSDNHPDVVQTWAGPAELRVDRLTGSTDYQGFFLAPTQFGGVDSRLFDLRHVNLRGTYPCTCILLWISGGSPLSLRDVWLQPNRRQTLARSVWPAADPRWAGLRAGKPPGGDFVPRRRVGAGYRSPDYLPVSARP